MKQIFTSCLARSGTSKRDAASDVMGHWWPNRATSCCNALPDRINSQDSAYSKANTSITHLGCNLAKITCEIHETGAEHDGILWCGAHTIKSLTDLVNVNGPERTPPATQSANPPRFNTQDLYTSSVLFLMGYHRLLNSARQFGETHLIGNGAGLYEA